MMKIMKHDGSVVTLDVRNAVKVEHGIYSYGYSMCFGLRDNGSANNDAGRTDVRRVLREYFDGTYQGHNIDFATYSHAGFIAEGRLFLKEPLHRQRSK